MPAGKRSGLPAVYLTQGPHPPTFLAWEPTIWAPEAISLPIFLSSLPIAKPRGTVSKSVYLLELLKQVVTSFGAELLA